MQKVARRCGCPHVTPYSYRHAFAFRALAKGVPIATLAKFMNTSVAQIERHITSSVSALKAVATIDVPLEQR
jgi:integrase